ncbi:MAG: potassium transporter KefA [Thermogutta sp.]|nr:MAG: potassium transporter KefA [Thermogutta sp.]
MRQALRIFHFHLVFATICVLGTQSVAETQERAFADGNSGAQSAAHDGEAGRGDLLAQLQVPRVNPIRPPLRVARAQEPEAPQQPAANGGTPPLSPVTPSGGGQPSTEPSVPSLSADDLQLRIQRVQSDPNLEDAVKSQIVAMYERALQELAAAEKARTQADQFRQQRESIDQEIKKLEAELASLEAASGTVSADNLSLEEIQKAAQEAEERLNAARSARDSVEAEVTRRNSARQTAKQRADAAQKRMEAARQALAAPPKADQIPALAEAERILHQAEWESARREAEASKEELAYYDKADEALLPLQRRVAAQRYRVAESEFQQWQQILAQRRQAEAVSRAEKAKQRREQLPPALRSVAEQVEKSAAEVAQLTAKVNAVSAELTRANQQLEELKQQFQTTRDRMGVVGMTGALGLWLRAQRAKLPDTYTLWQRIRKRQEDIRQAQWSVLEISDRHAQAPPLEEEIARWRSRLMGENLDRHPEWEEVLRELLTESYSLLEQQVKLYNRWLNDLVDLDNTERATIRLIEEYRRFIDEHILWIPNTPAFEPSRWAENFRLTLGVINMLVGVETWSEIGGIITRDVVNNPGLWISAILLLLVWGLVLVRSRRVLPDLAARVSRGAFYGFWPTLHAAAITAAETLWLPSALFFLAWRLVSPLESTSLSLAIAAGLRSAAEFLLVFDGLRRVAAPGGLGEGHFGWPSTLTATLRRHLRWFIILGVVVTYFCAAIHTSNDQRWEAGPGRLTFLAMMVLYAVMAAFLFRPRGSVWEAVRVHNEQGWFYRGRMVWWLAGMGTPIVLALLSLLGYSYTAIELAQRFRETIILPLGLGILEELFNRWLVVRKRRIGLDRARQKRMAEAQSAEAATESGGVVTPPAEAEPDLSLLGSQTRRLFGTLQVVLAVFLLWWIWADVLPALGMLRQVRLWGGTPAAASAAGTGSAAPAGTASGQEAAPAAAIPVPGRTVTLADVLLAIITLVIGVVFAKNIAGLIEIVLPQRLPVDPGLRYALHTVASYVVIGVAIILACGRLGLEWSQAQWLVAALGVGLGFGLQEIFANFVSGLIILFERPIRVGDLVTVGEFSGVVTKIRIRATTILNFERRELIIPNKEFITGKVINWTLSDRTNRVEVAVGVAYGTDPDRVISLLLDVAKNHPHVMSDPAPVVLFEGFGDSSLNFRLFAYVANYDNRLAVINGLHAAVYRRLTEEGISIPFPQRDIHVYYTEQPRSNQSSGTREASSSPESQSPAQEKGPI